MTHTVKSGETLSKIARSNGITLAQLLDANPKFKANPNRVRVGDVLNIPGGADAPTPTPTPPPAPAPTQPEPAPAPPAVTEPPMPPQPQPAPTRPLGKLSERYETGGRGPGVVSTGAGDAGGASYGSYQMTSKPGGGTVKRFVSEPDFPFRAKFAGLVPGGAQFTAVWKQLAQTDKDEFQASQHDYIKKTHFDPLVKKIIDENGVNVLTCSHALQDVIWSTAVQHGPGTNVPAVALRNTGTRPGAPSFDSDFIKAIYAERGRKNPNGGLARFSRNSPKVQQGVAQRFRDEQRDALAMLAEEQGG
ncbi:MAG: LysM peptidoglycan-binding domain-containing protein [Acidobacteria bacterium]|nr:LysM peptidoglycan-binding domain-containing protein [Acidobacteriota bacterium]